MSKKTAKKVIAVVAKSTNEYMGTSEGREGTVKKTYFWNGEHHYKGVWNDDNTTFEAPTALFNEKAQATVAPSIAPEDFAKALGFTTKRMIEQYNANIEGLKELHSKAVKTGKKVNGQTAEQWAHNIKVFENNRDRLINSTKK
jgi:hypothetical protein